MRFLVYYLDNFEPKYGIDCLVFDTNEYQVESNFDNFINYNGHLQKVIYIEEYQYHSNFRIDKEINTMALISRILSLISSKRVI